MDNGECARGEEYGKSDRQGVRVRKSEMDMSWFNPWVWLDWVGLGRVEFFGSFRGLDRVQ